MMDRTQKLKEIICDACGGVAAVDCEQCEYIWVKVKEIQDLFIGKGIFHMWISKTFLFDMNREKANAFFIEELDNLRQRAREE